MLPAWMQGEGHGGIAGEAENPGGGAWEAASRTQDRLESHKLLFSTLVMPMEILESSHDLHCYLPVHSTEFHKGLHSLGCNAGAAAYDSPQLPV